METSNTTATSSVQYNEWAAYQQAPNPSTDYSNYQDYYAQAYGQPHLFASYQQQGPSPYQQEGQATYSNFPTADWTAANAGSTLETGTSTLQPPLPGDATTVDAGTAPPPPPGFPGEQVTGTSTATPTNAYAYPGYGENYVQPQAQLYPYYGQYYGYQRWPTGYSQPPTSHPAANYAQSAVPSTVTQNAAAAPAVQAVPAVPAAPSWQATAPWSQQANGVKATPRPGLGAAPAGAQKSSVAFTIKPKISKKAGIADRNRTVAAVQPSYIKVGEPAKPAAAAPQPTAAAKDKAWPPSLRAYVERAFASCISDAARGELQAALKVTIQDATAKGEMWTRDWNTYPLPGAGVSPSPASTAKVANRWDTLQPAPRDIKADNKQTGRLQVSGRGMDARPKEQRRDRLRQRGNRKRNQRSPSSDSHSSDSTVERRGDVASAAESRKRAHRQGRFGRGTADGAVLWKERSGAPDRKQMLAEAAEEAEGAEDINWDDYVIRGTCQTLEKSYFRLTAVPDPATVRPEPVVQRALDRLVRLLATGEASYFYAEDQLKGMRQDLTVQHVKSGLAVAVYEAHARAALEYGNAPAEFNQCQSQLAALYAEGLPGCREEFLAYRILYQTLHARHGERVALLHTLRQVKESAGHPSVQHALAVRTALAGNDYVAFFRLYRTAPDLGRTLMDLCLLEVRFKALNAICRAYRPGITVGQAALLLGFQAGEGEEASAAAERTDVLPGCSRAHFPGRFWPKSDAAECAQECLDSLQAHGAVVSGAPGSEPASMLLQCKDSQDKLFVPQDNTKVAHGDQNLGIDDFLARALLAD